VSPARRGFLKTALISLAGAGAPTGLAPSAWANADVTPNHSQELLLRLPGVDGIFLRKAAKEELPSELGVVLGLYRYEPAVGESKTIDRLTLPWMDVRGGLYVRSAVPYRIRMVLDPDEGELTTRIVLNRRASLAAYRETPRWIDTPPWQVVVVIG
jgi:hypothetical protein